MSDLRRYVLDTARSMVRIGFLTGVLYCVVENFDSSEAKVIGAYAAAETGLRGFDWLKPKKDE